MSPINRKFRINYAKDTFNDKIFICLYWV